MPAWLHQFHGDKVLTSFSEEDQKLAIDTEWDRDSPPDLEEVETQDITDVELKWLIECDNISIDTTGSTFLAVEDEHQSRLYK